MGMFIGFGLWHGAFILYQTLPDVTLRPSIAILAAVGAIGWIYWCYHLYKMIQMGKVMNNNPNLAQALNDEFYKQIELKAFRNAFWMVMGVTGLYIFFSTSGSPSIHLLPNLVIFTGVMGAIGSFLYLNSRDQHE